jgi:hypothetical protein
MFLREMPPHIRIKLEKLSFLLGEFNIITTYLTQGMYSYGAIRIDDLIIE